MKFTVWETGYVDGGCYRIVEFTDGSARVEEWRGGKWIPGGASFGEFFMAMPVSARRAVEFGIPIEDVAPPVRTAAPVKPLTSHDLGCRLPINHASIKPRMM